MKRIAQLRKEKGLSQIGFAMKMNITQYMVSAYESGRNQPSNEMLVQMADFFNVSADYLLERTSSRIMLMNDDNFGFSSDDISLIDNYNMLTKKQKDIAKKVIFCLRHLEEI